MMPITRASEAESGTRRRKTQLPKCTNIPVKMITFSCLLMSPFYILQFSQNPPDDLVVLGIGVWRRMTSRLAWGHAPAATYR